MQNVRRVSDRLSESLRKCLAVVLDAELSGKPHSVEQYRARNPKKVPILEALTSQRLIKRDAHYLVTFWGLLQARSRAGSAVLKACEKVYKVLGRHYREHQYAPLSLLELQRQTGLTSQQIIQCVLFLERSPSSPAIGSDWQSVGVVAIEDYVTRSFATLKDRTRKINQNSQGMPGALLKTPEHTGLTVELDTSESEPVRNSWS
jgi:hypothetical protein